jgi:hypothetical protein
MGEHKRNRTAAAEMAGLLGPRNGKGRVNIPIDVRDCRRRACECGCTAFAQRFQLFEIPTLLRSAVDAPDSIFAQDWVCVACGKAQGTPQMQLLDPISKIQPADEHTGDGPQEEKPEPAIVVVG